MLKRLALAILCIGRFAGALEAQEVVHYYHLDAIGNVRALTDQSGNVVERHDYLPFGEECTTGPCATNPGAGAGQPKKFTGKERDVETGLDYFGARYYRANPARFTTVDPVMNAKANLTDPQRWNRYAYAKNNPLRYMDPDGGDTITAQDGRVLQVRNNGDLGVYRGSDRVGETAYWDEFRAHDGRTGAVKPDVILDARIDFGSSWDGAIAAANAYADSLGLVTTAAQSRNNEYFDIKVVPVLAPYGVGTGRLLNGKYATAESAGNYLAGMNMATGTYAGGRQLTRDEGMKLAGAVQAGKWSKVNAGRVLAFGTCFGPAPYHGETTHAGRRIDEGFVAGAAKR